MKLFTIYEHPDGRKGAIKNGFSWPGFGFSGIWLLVKQLWIMAAIFWFAVFIPGVGIIVCAIIWFICGFMGNDLLKKNLYKKGFVKKGAYKAKTPDDALAKYYSENKK